MTDRAQVLAPRRGRSPSWSSCSQRSIRLRSAGRAAAGRSSGTARSVPLCGTRPTTTSGSLASLRPAPAGQAPTNQQGTAGTASPNSSARSATDRKPTPRKTTAPTGTTTATPQTRLTSAWWSSSSTPIETHSAGSPSSLTANWTRSRRRTASASATDSGRSSRSWPVCSSTSTTRCRRSKLR